MKQAARLSLIVAALSLLAGCGGGEGSPGTTAASPHLLLAPVDFAALQPARDAHLSEPCGRAATILGGEGGTVSASQVSELGGAELVETVGAFPSTGAAVASFYALISEARDRCIQRALPSLYPQAGAKVEKPSWKPQSLAEEESLRRYLIAANGSSPSAEFDAFVLRTGSCVAALIVSSENGPAPRTEVMQAARAAGGLLKSAPPCAHE